MRALVLVRPTHPLPLEMVTPLLEAFKQWRVQYRAQMESFYFFASGKGGCGVINAPDELALMRQLASFPFAQVSDITVEPLVDGDEGLAVFSELFAQMAASMGSAG